MKHHVKLGIDIGLVSREAEQIRMLISDLTCTVQDLEAEQQNRAGATDLPRAATISSSPLLCWRTVSPPSKSCVLVSTARNSIPLVFALTTRGFAHWVLRFEPRLLTAAAIGRINPRRHRTRDSSSENWSLESCATPAQRFPARSGKARARASRFAPNTPRSVISPLTSRAGVTSKP